MCVFLFGLLSATIFYIPTLNSSAISVNREMDKTRDVWRGGSSWFSATKQQSSKGIDGDGNCGILVKSKKEKLRRLSSVGNEMDSLSRSTSSTKRVKLPKKFFDDDYDPVDHVSVPRKLRSAIKKRPCESVSPPMPHPRKLGHSVKNRVEVEAKDCTKKINSCMLEDSTGSQEEAIVRTITKEEEEVAETLYALAGMFPDRDKANDSIILKEKPSETKFSPVPAPKDKDCGLICDEAVDNSANEVDNSVSLVKLPMIFPFSKDETSNEKPSFKPMAKLPPWLVNATNPCSSENVGFTEKDSAVLGDRKKSWKTCTAHVYISHLIRDLKLPDGTEELPIKIKPDKQSKQEAFLATNNLRMIINGSIEKKSSNEVRNAILLHKRLFQDQQQACTTSEIYTSHNQNFNVFSDYGGNCGVEASNIMNRYGNRAEPASGFHYMNSPAQDRMIIPQMLPQNNYCSTSYNNHLSAASAQQVQMQHPPYYGPPFSGPSSSHMTPTMLPKQQQQQLWAAALVSQPPHYSPKEVSASPHLHNWPNSSSSNYVPNSLLEVFAPKYAQMGPQHQQFVPITSFLAPKRRESLRVPLGCEENNGGGLSFPNNSSSLQMLCNEHL